MNATEELRNTIRNTSREEVVLLLYDGAIRFSEKAKEKMEDDDARHRLLLRAQNVVLELLYALDQEKGGEIAANLAGLYTYCYNQLVEANVYKDIAKVDTTLEILRSLREAWAKAVKKMKGGTR